MARDVGAGHLAPGGVRQEGQAEVGWGSEAPFRGAFGPEDPFRWCRAHCCWHVQNRRVRTTRPRASQASQERGSGNRHCHPLACALEQITQLFRILVFLSVTQER